MKRGFTLVEMIFYVAIVALVLLVIVNMVLVVANSNREFRVSRNIQNAASATIERVSRDTQDAISVDTAQSILNIHPGSLYLNIEDQDQNAKVIEIVLTNGRIHVLEDSVDLGPITSDDVQITNLVFNLNTASSTQIIRTDIGISSSINSVSKEENFYTTSIIKGSY